ncbi:MAG: Crp/Fnr family transcriptional regulator [Gemmatimonas sp.]
MPDVRSAVASFARFLTLTEDEAAYLDGITAERRTIPAHRQVICDGRSCNEVFIAVSGWLAAYKQLRDGGRQILALRLSGDFIGIECLAYRVAPYSVATLTPCLVAPISRTTIDDMLRRFPRLAETLMLAASYNTAQLQQFAVSLGRRDAFSRIAHLLTELTLRLTAAGAERRVPLTQQDIADCTGLTTPYVNRILKRMREAGLVCLDRHALTVVSLEAMAQAGGFRPEYLQVVNHRASPPIAGHGLPAGAAAGATSPTPRALLHRNID